MVRRHGPRAAAASAVLAVLVFATGCAPVDPPSSALPAGVSIGVQQNRTDVAPRRIQVVVTNESGTDLTVDSVTLDSGQFVEPTTSADVAALVGAGRTVNLPLQLPATDCTAEAADPSVRIELTVGDDSIDALVTPEDRFERLPQLRQEDCLRESVDEIAVLSLRTPVTTTTVAGTTVATASLTVAPTGAAGSFVLDAVSGTTLVAIADPATAVIVPQRPLGAEIRGSDAPSEIEITLVPNRCDAHAIAEDKRGSVLPLEVTASGFGGGRIFVAATDEVRASIYDFVRAACGLG